MSEDSGFNNKNKPQMKAPRVTPLEGVSTYAPQGIRVRRNENPQGFGIDERRCGVDLCGSLGKGMLAKEKIETLGNFSGLTPLGFGVNVPHRIMDRENNEIIPTGTNSGSVSSYGVCTSSLLNSSHQYAENTEMPGNSSGLSTLHPFDEINSIKKKSVSLIDGFSDNEGLETLKNSSGLSPLNFDSEPQMNADKRRYSPQRTLRTQSPRLTNLANQGE